MADLNGIPFIWDNVEDNNLLGSLFLSGAPRPLSNSIAANSISSQNNISQNVSPFGDNSLFSNSQDIEYVTYINFKKLIKDIKGNQDKIIPYRYDVYESQATLQPLLFRGVPDKIIEKIISESEEEDDPLIKKAKELIRDMLPTPPRIRVDREYKDENGKYVFLDGKLNIKEGFIKIAKDSIGFVFELNAAKRIIKFTDYFHYVDESSGLPKVQWAISIEAKRYENYLGLCDAEGLKISDNSKKNIVTKFTNELGNSKALPQTIAWLYDVMPDFVFLQRDKNLLIKDLAAILIGKVNEDGINEEVIVLKILQAFITDSAVDQDNLLYQLTTTFIGKKTLFEVLYTKMNDWGGADNWTAAILMLFKIWSVSKFAEDNNYTYTGQPETLAYESKKILGFYDSGYSFKFDNSSIEVLIDVTEYYGERRLITKRHFTSYNFLQPIQLHEFDQEGELKILNRIPAFYLKAFDDKNAWENFEKAAWLILDIAMTFTGVGNLLKLRYLRYLSKLEKGIVILGSLQVANGVLGIMLNYLDVCKDEEFCDKLRAYLFWFDLASLGTDVILKKMLQKSAREALNKMPEKIKKEQRGIEEHLKEIADDDKFLLRSTIGGKPIDPILLKKIKTSFEKQGGKMDIGGDTQKFLDSRGAEGITYNEKLILLDENASISAVYEELIHSAQHRTGKYAELIDEHGARITELLMEKDAAEKLLKNVRVWKIPDDEVKIIEQRLAIFNNHLKQKGL